MTEDTNNNENETESEVETPDELTEPSTEVEVGEPASSDDYEDGEVPDTVSNTFGIETIEGESAVEPTVGETEPLSLTVDIDFDRESLRELIDAAEGDESLSDSQRMQVRQLLSERDAELYEYVNNQINAIEHPEAVPTPANPDAITEERVIELIAEHGGGGGYGDGEYGGGGYGGVDPAEELEALRARVEAMLARLDVSLRDLETALSRVVGPSPSGLDGKFHSTAGWGVHFETDYPIRLLNATVVANQSGYTNVEIHRYDAIAGETTGMVASREIGIPGEGTQELALDLTIDEPGHYVLARDYSNSPADADRVALRRTDTDYTGWTTDSGEGLTFHGGVDVGGRWGDNRLWYYFADLHIRDALPERDGETA